LTIKVHFAFSFLFVLYLFYTQMQDKQEVY